MAGNENSGPQYKLPYLKKQMSRAFAKKFLAIWDGLLDKAVNGDKEAAIYCIDRELGRPRQEIDARVRSTLEFSPDDLALMRRVSVSELPAINAEVKELSIGTGDNETLTDLESLDNEKDPDNNELASE